MRRREFVALSGLLCVPHQLHAQQLRVIGFLSPAAETVNYSDGLSAGLREFGYIEGHTIRTAARWARGHLDELPRLARELLDQKIEVLVASLTQAALAARSATSSVPIVMAGVADPVAAGLIHSLARPGVGITGTSSLSAEIVGKQLELLQEAIPSLDRIAVMYNPQNSTFQRLQVAQAERAAQQAGLKLHRLEVSARGDIEPAFEAVGREQIRAVAILGDPLFALHAGSIAEIARSKGVATSSAGRPYADAGVLLNYGPSLFQLHQRAAFYVDRILRGTSPADLPVELPTKFETFVNLKTARALGLAVPPSLLARADEVIE
jgi:putative ABC transport system substrate-binding protein